MYFTLKICTLIAYIVDYIQVFFRNFETLKSSFQKFGKMATVEFSSISGLQSLALSFVWMRRQHTSLQSPFLFILNSHAFFLMIYKSSWLAGGFSPLKWSDDLNLDDPMVFGHKIGDRKSVV